MSRHVIFLLLAALSQWLGARTGFRVSALGLPSPWLLLSDMPIFLFFVLIVLKDRLAATSPIKRLLAHGRLLLGLLGFGQILLIVALQHPAWLRPNPLPLLDLLVLALCLYYLLGNRKAGYFFQHYGQSGDDAKV
jgi:hypothetical protein